MTILATIIVLGVLIFVHELGHFLAAKSVGVDVQRFSIGLGPKVFGVTRGETEYVLSAIPLGGYVKMGGMGDEEVTQRLEGGAPAVEREPGPGDFDGKPIWARTLVISAGVIMNMLFAFAVYTTSAAVWGARELATTRVGEVRTGLLPSGTEALAGLPMGARIVQVGDRPIEKWGDVRAALLEAEAGPLALTYADPDGSLDIRIPPEDGARQSLVSALDRWVEPEVGALLPGAPAERAGIEAADRVLAVDGEPIESWWEFVRAVEARPEQRTEVLLLREGRQLTRVVVPESQSSSDPVSGADVRVGRVGIYPPMDELVSQPVGPVEAVALGYRETVFMTGMILGFLRDLVTGNVSARSVGSIVTIGEASGEAAAAGIETFLRFMALFSVNLAVLNLLPIPVLDGGHLLFLAIEKLRGRALTVEQRLRWSNVGFLIVVGLMVWALSNDVIRLFERF
jgi:regulator of sigma E protease